MVAFRRTRVSERTRPMPVSEPHEAPAFGIGEVVLLLMIGPFVNLQVRRLNGVSRSLSPCGYERSASAGTHRSQSDEDSRASNCVRSPETFGNPSSPAAPRLGLAKDTGTKTRFCRWGRTFIIAYQKW